MSDDSNCSSSSSLTGVSPQKRSKGSPYIPSYMDLSNGPEPCVVCGDSATGYHYRCMTCEGCKGFFRRTIQKNLQYHCKWNGNCLIDKNSRNQCQQCRFHKCLRIGMATDLVLNDKQRVAKRKLIDDNRKKRKQDPCKISRTYNHEEVCIHDCLSSNDIKLVQEIFDAYEATSGFDNESIYEPLSLPYLENSGAKGQSPEAWVQLAKIITPSVINVVEFAKQVPGFSDLIEEDQIRLLKACCMEIMCLRVACRYDSEYQALVMYNGSLLSRTEVTMGEMTSLVEPIFDFAVGLSKLKLNTKEVALLAAILLMQSDRSGLKDSESVERLQDEILGAFKRYIANYRPTQPVHWAKILMKVTDLRTISTRHAERILSTQLSSQKEIPQLFLEMFVERKRDGDSFSINSSSPPSNFSDITGDEEQFSNYNMICRSPGTLQPGLNY